MKTPKARKLPSGSWFCRVRIDGKDICITRPTEKEAIAEAMAIKAGIKKAEKTPRRITVTQAVDAYIEARENVLSPATIRGYRAIQKGRFQAMQHQYISAVTPEMWQRAVNREARLCSAKTLTNAWRFLASVIHEATGEQVTVRLPQIVPNERPYLMPEQVPVFVEAIRGTSIEIPALLALSSLRRSEILNLRWCDIDLGKGVLQVNGAAVYDADGALVHKKENKNRTSRRIVPIIQPLRLALEGAKHKGEYVVAMKPSGIYAHINRVCEQNDLPKVGIHGLRHSFASLAYHLSIPEKAAMEIGGWANDQTMRKIYTHISRNDLTKHAAAFSEFFQTHIGNEFGNTP